MKKITKIMRVEMTDERIAQLEASYELSRETHLMRLAVYAKYNPTINALKADKTVELHEIQAYASARRKEIFPNER